MNRETKHLVKGAKELFSYLHDIPDFVFEGPDYLGISDGVFNQLNQTHFDALESSVVIWQTRKKDGISMTSDDFVGLVKDEYSNLLPPVHDKHDKPGKKHDKKRHEDFSSDVEFEPKRKFR